MFVLLGHEGCGNLLSSNKMIANARISAVLGTAFFIEILTLLVIAVASNQLDSDVPLGNNQSIDRLLSY